MYYIKSYSPHLPSSNKLKRNLYAKVKIKVQTTP